MTNPPASLDIGRQTHNPVKMWTAVVCTGLVACCLTWAQTADKPNANLTFEVASVKPASPPVPDGRGRILIMGPSGGPGSKDPGRIRYPFSNLKNLITIAYGVKDFQVSGPAFLDSERFEVTATMPPETTKEQFQVMMQNLLAERFGLKVHRETKELPMFALVVAKGGPKMTESVIDPAQKAEPDGPPPPLPPGGPKMGPDGFPLLPFVSGRAGIFRMMMPGRSRLQAQQQTMQDLANNLSQTLARPVYDETGLKAKYDFTLTFSSEGLNGPMGPLPPPPPGAGPGPGGEANVFVPSGETPPDIFRAVQSQLGLKLEAKKGQVEVIIIDHAEKTPTEN